MDQGPQVWEPNRPRWARWLSSWPAKGREYLGLAGVFGPMAVVWAALGEWVKAVACVVVAVAFLVSAERARRRPDAGGRPSARSHLGSAVGSAGMAAFTIAMGMHVAFTIFIGCIALLFLLLAGFRHLGAVPASYD